MTVGNGQRRNPAQTMIVVDGMVFVGSGYSQWGGLPGNVLLAFSVDGR
jgi:hypothetical protein